MQNIQEKQSKDTEYLKKYIQMANEHRCLRDETTHTNANSQTPIFRASKHSRAGVTIGKRVLGHFGYKALPS